MSEKDEMIAEVKKETMQELDVPIAQIWEGVLMMPLVGIIDTVRAQKLMENLLEEIAETESEVAILDIRGVPVVDTRVAAHLIDSFEAAKMLGAECILTGISPNNAQTLVRLGVDLSEFITRNTLQAGVEEAFKRLGIRLKKIEE